MRSHMSRNPWQAKTHTWQVDATAGVDTNSGNAAAPIQTIAKVNALALKPGDRVLFKRGEVWTERLDNSCSGRPGAPIVYGSYGTGTQPIINPAATATHAFRNMAASWVTVNGLDLRGGTYCPIEVNGGHGFNLLNCSVTGAGTMSAVTIFGDNLKNIVVSGNTITGAPAGSGIELGSGSLATGPVHVIITDNVVNGNGATASHHGIYIKYVTDGLVARNSCSFNAGAGIKARYSNPQTRIEGNICNSNLLDGFQLNLTLASDGLILCNNVAMGNSVGFNLADAVVGALIYHNTIVNNSYRGIQFYDATIAGNIFKNNIIFVDRTVTYGYPMRIITEAQAASNTYDNNEIYAVGITTPVDAVWTVALTLAQWQALVGSPDPHSITNSPLFADATLRASSTVDADSAAGQKVLNVASTVGFVVGEQVTIALGTARYETKYIASIQAGISLTMTVNLANAHTAAQADTVKSLILTDLHLQTTSPCKNAGATGLGVPLDYDGVVREATPDIGAYEYV